MSFNIGVNVLEVEGGATPSIVSAPTSVAGFIVRSMRGVAGQAIRVTSWSEFVDRFGTQIADAYGAYAVQGFFDNGGTVAYVVRVQAGAVAARVTLTGGAIVVAGFRGQEDQGNWGESIGVTFADNAADSSLFDLSVWQVTTRNGETIRSLLETHEALRMQRTPAGLAGLEDVINNPLTGSRYIRVTVAAGDIRPPNTSTPIMLVNGDDGDAPTDAEYGADTILGAFDTYDVQLLTCPETGSREFATLALAKCESLGDRMFVGHTLESVRTPAQVKTTYATPPSNDLRGDKVYGALYYPWISVMDPLTGAPKWVPPTGHVLGVYARTDLQRGVWKAPAGDATNLRGALNVRYDLSDAEHTELVKQSSVNGIRALAGKGIIVDSARTLSTNPLWYYVNVRLLFNFVESSLRDGLRWVVQEPNDPILWSRVEFNAVRPFLMGLWRARAFGPGKPADVFTVKIDAENNTPADIKLGRLNLEVYFYPSRPAETIVIRVAQQDSGAKVSEG